jgi:hypothetical protein
MSLFAPGQAITWIRVSKPTFDLVGVIVSSLLATAIFAALSALAGVWLGTLLVRLRGRRHELPGAHLALLHLSEPEEPPPAVTPGETVSSA